MRKFFQANSLHSISVRFPCPYCGEEVGSPSVDLPVPNFLSKENSLSYNCEESDAICDSCGEQYYFSVCVGNENAYVDFDDTDDIKNIRIDEISHDEFEQYYRYQLAAIAENKHLFDTFKSSLNDLKKLNNIKLEDQHLTQKLRQYIYTGVITVMETFLSDTIINLTLSNQELLKNFVESYPKFRRQKFALSEVFEKTRVIQKTVQTELLDTIFHDLRKVREMYNSTFKIKFPDISEPSKCVLIRHDIVHRYGKSKDGAPLKLSKTDVIKEMKIVEDFVADIAKKLEIT